jgi:outer membrane protein assembly factor BamB
VHNSNDKNFIDYFFAAIIPVGLIAIGTISLYFWLSADAAEGLVVREPLTHGAQQASSDDVDIEKLPDEFLRFDGTPSDLSGAWPRFRGANFDAVSSENVTMARTWPENGPEVLWSVDLGEGYAGAAVLVGRVYVLDYDREKQADAIRCFSLADGKEIWRYSYHVKVKRNHGMSRTVPAVTEKHIVTLGPKCHVTCLDSVTGDFRWKLDLVKDFGAKVPEWYAGQCPLIEDEKAIIAVGGKNLMMAVDCQTGQIIWETPNPNKWLMTHSSVIPAEFAGKRMYVYCASGGVVGVSAEDGSLLWQTTEWKIRIANVPTPVEVGDGLFFLCGDYNAGGMILKLTQQADVITAQPLLVLDAEVYGSPQHTPIFYNGHIYGVNADMELACLDLNGNVLWTSTSTHKFGRGPYVIADGLIYVMDDDGVLTMVEATPDGYKQIAQAKVLEGPDAWGAMAIASGRLILRDLNRMICLNIAEK